MKVFCVFSLESPHQGDSNEYTQYTIFNTNRKIDLNYLKSIAMKFLGAQAQVRNCRGKRAISVRVIEVLLCKVSPGTESVRDFFYSEKKGVTEHVYFSTIQLASLLIVLYCSG